VDAAGHMTVTLVNDAVFPYSAVVTAITAFASLAAGLTILTIKSVFVSKYEAFEVPPSLY